MQVKEQLQNALKSCSWCSHVRPDPDKSIELPVVEEWHRCITFSFRCMEYGFVEWSGLYLNDKFQ